VKFFPGDLTRSVDSFDEKSSSSAYIYSYDSLMCVGLTKKAISDYAVYVILNSRENHAGIKCSQVIACDGHIGWVFDRNLVRIDIK